jgi:flagellar biosynthesis protein FlhG
MQKEQVWLIRTAQVRELGLDRWRMHSAESTGKPREIHDAAPLHVRHLIAIGGGRGGVGKSVVAVNLGVYLAQLGRTVALVDADPNGGELHTMLGVSVPARPRGPDDPPEEDLPMFKTPVPGLLLSPQAYATGSTVPVRPGRKARWARRLRQLDVDYVLMDLGSGTAPATLDLFLEADLGICVTSPEPPSVEATYRFCRALFHRQLRRLLFKDRFRMRLSERAQAELPPLPSPQELVRAVARYDAAVGELASAELSKLRPRLVVNCVRLRTDSDLGPGMCEMATRYLGVNLDSIGHVEQDDAVWLSVVRRRPLLIDSPTSKSARNLERVARRMLALVTTRDQTRPPAAVELVPQELSLYDVLWTHRGATDEELRRAYKRQRELFQADGLALTSLMSEAQLQVAQARIEEAHDTLLDPLRRRAYDVSTFPEQEEDQPRASAQVDTALAAERAMLRQELLHEIHAETDFTGALLAKVRESLGIELEEISNHTKISQAHLRAIEAEEFDKLPALVYARGFVQQVASYLKLDPTQVSRTYLRRMRAWRATNGLPGP